MAAPKSPLSKPIPPGIRSPETSGPDSIQNETRFVVYRTATGGIEGVFKFEPQLSSRQCAVCSRVREIPPGNQLHRYRVIAGRITRI